MTTSGTDLKTTRTDGILCVATMTVHGADLHELGPAVRAWVTAQTHGVLPGACSLDADTFMAAHPMLGIVAGAAWGFLDRDGGVVRLRDVGVSCGDETVALQAVGTVLAHHAGSIVAHGGGGTSLQFVLARLLALGLSVPFSLKAVTERLVDTADIFVPLRPGSFPPWHVVCQALEIGSWDDPLDLATLASAYRCQNRVALGSELLSQLEGIGALYTSTFGGRHLQVERLPYDGRILEPERDGR